MSPEEYIKSKITSPLAESTTRARTNLLLASSTAVVIYHTGLIPNHIEGLGITFSPAQQGAFISCLLVLVAYQLVSFSLSAIPDYYYAKLRRKAYTEQCMLEEDFLKNGKSFEELRADFQEIFNPLETDPSTISKLLTYRVIFDVSVPLLVALYSMVSLIILLLR